MNWNSYQPIVGGVLSQTPPLPWLTSTRRPCLLQFHRCSPNSRHHSQLIEGHLSGPVFDCIYRIYFASSNFYMTTSCLRPRRASAFGRLATANYVQSRRASERYGASESVARLGMLRLAFHGNFFNGTCFIESDAKHVICDFARQSEIEHINAVLILIIPVRLQFKRPRTCSGSGDVVPSFDYQ